MPLDQGLKNLVEDTRVLKTSKPNGFQNGSKASLATSLGEPKLSLRHEKRESVWTFFLKGYFLQGNCKSNFFNF